MATVIFQAPAGASIGVVVSGFMWRIRPTELFGIDTAVSEQTDAFLAAGFDYSEHDPYTATPASVLPTSNNHKAHNPYGLVVDPP